MDRKQSDASSNTTTRRVNGSGFFGAITAALRTPTIPEQVRNYKETSDPAKKQAALWAIREQAEKRKNPSELIQSGVIPIMVKVLNEEKEDERLWALWVLRYLSDFEEAAAMILQEPNAIEGLVNAICEANVGSMAAKRSVECVMHLSRYQSTQILLARDDVFNAITAAMAAAPPEASAALKVYLSLSETETGGRPLYLGSMVRETTMKNLKSLSENSKMSEDDRSKAVKLMAHLNE